jgi:hypothetical protein
MNALLRHVTAGTGHAPDADEDVMQSEQFTNLKVHRSDANAWDRRGWRNPLDDTAGPWLVSIAGVSLLLYAAFSARRRAASSLWWGATGAGLLSCAATRFRSGHWPTIGRPDPDPLGADVVQVESVDSFPASDAPSSNATTASPRPMRGAD